MLFITLYGVFLGGIANAQSKIKEVLIYSDRAEVTRTATKKCLSGFTQIEYENIPNTVDHRSIRAVSSSNSTEVIGVTSKEIAGTVTVDETEQQLIMRQNKLQQDIKREQNKVAVLQSEQRQTANFERLFYQALQEEMRNPKVSTSKWDTSLTNFRNTYQNLDSKKRVHELQIRELKRELDLINKQLQRRGSTQRASTVTASVTVDCKKQSSSTVLLTYIVSGATWSPEYDLHFSSGKVDIRNVTLTTSAIIRQSTGENWEQAAITLTTAKPNLGSTPPYPKAIYVDGQERTTQKALIQAQEDRSSFEEGTPNNTTTSHSIMGFEGQTFSFRLPNTKSTILSNGQEHWVPIDERKGKSTVKYILTPKVSPLVYEAISMDNIAPYPLLSGMVHVQNNGSYMGKHPIPYIGAGAPLELAIGQLPELKVFRNTLHDKRKLQILGKNKKLQRAYQIKVSNNSKIDKNIEIRENIPVSKHDDINVEVGTKTTQGFKLDKKQGFITWTSTIKAGKSETFFLYYEVTIPNEWEI